MLHIALAPGTLLLDRFVVGAPLGSGGMAQVHRAHDQLTGVDVAIKVLHQDAHSGGSH